MTPPAQSLRIPADLTRLADVRQLVRQAARDAGATPGAVDDLVQAVDEAATNTIVHGYAGAPGWVEVTVAVAGPHVVVTLEDEAPEFDPTTLPEPDMTVPALARGPGGMGIHLMRLAADDIAYRSRASGGNILTLTRSLDPGREEAR
jgi:serine/threonine-protein kinase RsbW